MTNRPERRWKRPSYRPFFSPGFCELFKVRFQLSGSVRLQPLRLSVPVGNGKPQPIDRARELVLGFLDARTSALLGLFAAV